MLSRVGEASAQAMSWSAAHGAVHIGLRTRDNCCYSSFDTQNDPNIEPIAMTADNAIRAVAYVPGNLSFTLNSQRLLNSHNF